MAVDCTGIEATTTGIEGGSVLLTGILQQKPRSVRKYMQIVWTKLKSSQILQLLLSVFGVYI